MAGVNKVILIGNLGKDPEVRFTPGGKAVCNFSIATSESWKDKDGNKQEKTEWHNIVAWGKTGELAGEYLHKGSKVYVEGKLTTDKYEKEGQTHYSTKITAENLTFLDSKGSGGGGKKSEDSDDAPF